MMKPFSSGWKLAKSPRLGMRFAFCHDRAPFPAGLCLESSGSLYRADVRGYPVGFCPLVPQGNWSTLCSRCCLSPTQLHSPVWWRKRLPKAEWADAVGCELWFWRRENRSPLCCLCSRVLTSGGKGGLGTVISRWYQNDFSLLVSTEELA